MTALKWIGWIVGVPVGLFVLLMIYMAVTETPEEARRLAQRRATEEACDKMMADSALGNERRMTRAICEKALEDLQQRR